MDVEHLNVVLGAKLGGLRRGLSTADSLVAATRKKFDALNGASNRQTRLAPGLQRALDLSRQRVDGLGNAGLLTGRRLDRMGRGILASSGAARGLGKSIAFASTAFLGGAGLGAGIKFVLGKAASFETELNTLQAVTRSSGQVMKQAGDLARKLGADITIPGVSAADAAVTMTELAKGGLQVDQAMAAAKGTLQLATAAQLGFQESAKITVSVLNAFGLEGSEATKVADLLAAAANASQGEISDMAIALQQASAQAHAAGLSAHETVTALTLLAKAGIQGSDSGTSLRVMLQRFVPQGKKAAVLMHDLGLEAFDASGKMLPLRAIIDKYSRVLSQLNPKQRQFVLQTIFGSDATRAANIILVRGVKAYDDAARATAKAGEAQRVASARTKGLAGAFEAARNAADTLAIIMGERLLPILTPLVRRFADWLAGLSESESFQRKFTSGVAQAVDVLGAFAGRIGDAIGLVNRLAQAVGGWKSALSFLLSGFLVLKVVQLSQAIRVSLIASGFGALGVTSRAAAAATVANLGLIRVAVIGLATTIKSALISTGFGALIVGVGVVIQKLGLLDGMIDKLGLTAGKTATHLGNLRAAIDGLKQTRHDITEATLAIQRAQLAVQRAEENVRREFARSGRQSLAYKEAVLALQEAKLQVARSIDQLSAAQKREQTLQEQRRRSIAGLDLQMRTLNQTARDDLATLRDRNRTYGEHLGVINEYRRRMLKIADEARAKNIPSIEVMARKAATLALGLQRIPTMKEIQIGAFLNGTVMTPENMKVFGTNLGTQLGDGMGRSVVFSLQPYVDTVAQQLAELAAIAAGRDQYHSGGTAAVTQQAKVRGDVSGVKGAVVSFAGMTATQAGMDSINVMSGFRSGSKVAGSGKTSLHASGNAVDLGPYYGETLIQVGQAALMAAGMPASEARRHTSFAGTVNGWEIIFNNHVGGDHTDHVHIGREKATNRPKIPTPDLGLGGLVDDLMAKALGAGSKTKKASPAATAKSAAREKLEAELNRINDLAQNKLLPPALVAQLRGRVEQAEKLIARASGKKSIPEIRRAAKDVKAAVDNAVKQIDIVNAFKEKVGGTRDEVKQRLQELLSEPLQTVSDEAFLIAQREAARITKVLTTKLVTPGRRSALQQQLNGYRDTIERGLKGALKAAEKAQSAFERAFTKLGRKAMQAFDRETAVGLAAIDARFGELTPEERELAAFEAELERQARELERSEAQRDLQEAIAGGDPDEIRRAQQRLTDITNDEQRDALRTRAEAARAARDAERERERQAYEEQREEQREALEQRLEDMKAQLLAGEGDLAQIGETLGIALTDPMLAAIQALQKVWQEFVDAVNKARISVGLGPIGGGSSGGAGKVAAQAGKIGLIPAAHGVSTTVTKPTLFLTGEGGSPEHVEVTPMRSGGGRGGDVVITFTGPVYGADADELARRLAPKIRRELLRDGELRGRRGSL